MMMFIVSDIVRNAKRGRKRIIFPETEDPRVMKAIKFLSEKKIVNVIALSRKRRIKMKNIEVIDMNDKKKKFFFAYELYKIRADKGMTIEEAKKLINDPIYFGLVMLRLGMADGMVAGSLSTTSHLLRAAFQIIKTRKKVNRVSGSFLMINKNKRILFADTSVNILPNSEELAEIALETAHTANMLGFDSARIALLSFSTKGSAKHELVDKVANAVEIVRKKTLRKRNIVVDGEMQVDAALVPKVARLKCPTCKIKGNANVLIFPSLESANIGYKLVQRLGKWQAVGTIIQGLSKPVNDLSRGCSVDDIINLSAITALQADYYNKL